jgi:outer membrane protein assembly factor BamD (BamD/ComL family)
MSKHEGRRTRSERGYGTRALLARLVLGTSLLCGSGCTWDQLNPFKPPTPPPPPVDTFILRTGGLTPEKPPTTGVQAELAGAHELFRREDYATAQRVFHHIADKKSNPATVAQEALYYEAECLRLQGYLPKAADTYASLLDKFHFTPYRDQAIQHMYDIAHFWLNDTWDEAREKKSGRWFVLPRFVSFERSKPVLDREGRAVEKLEEVVTNDLQGPLAEKALFLCGHVKLYNEDYREADTFFTRLYQDHPRSTFAPEALELAIFCKTQIPGGPDYDGRKVAEARKLVDAALRQPGVDECKKQQLMEQLTSITLHQADKDYKMAEFWRRTGHPGAAYFQYEIVCRRYPNTEYHTKAYQRMMEIREKAMKDQAQRPTPYPAATGPGAGGPPAAGKGNGGSNGGQSETAPQPRVLPSDLGQR